MSRGFPHKIVFFFVALSASAQRPAFEVASVRPANPAGTAGISHVGDRITFTNFSLEMLVKWAYRIENDRLAGKPAWLDNVRFDIAAKTAVSPAPGQLESMMQPLLAERFGLTVHKETKELTTYNMVVGKNGPKVKLTATRDLSIQNPFNMSSRGRLTGTSVSTGMLATVLSEQLGRSVSDQTGLKGFFDFTLQWTPDDAESAEADTRAGPSLFTAIQEQLGLRLESHRSSEDFLVIDRIERTPTPN